MLPYSLLRTALSSQSALYFFDVRENFWMLSGQLFPPKKLCNSSLHNLNILFYLPIQQHQLLLNPNGSTLLGVMNASFELDGVSIWWRGEADWRISHALHFLSIVHRDI